MNRALSWISDNTQIYYVIPFLADMINLSEGYHIYMGMSIWLSGELLSQPTPLTLHRHS